MECTYKGKHAEVSGSINHETVLLTDICEVSCLSEHQLKTGQTEPDKFTEIHKMTSHPRSLADRMP